MNKLVRSLLCMAAVTMISGAFYFVAGGTAAATVYADTKDYSSYYDVSGQTITIKYGYTYADIRDILDAALREARDMATAENPVTVSVPQGTYYLSANLHIFSNTTLDLTGVTLKYIGTASHNMVMSGTNGAYMGESDYNRSSKCAGYNGFENITIKGGTFVSSDSNTSTIIRISHARNVTLDGVTLKGGGCAHQSEVAAIDGFYVKNCNFLDWNGKNGKTGNYEALQLDIPCSTDVFKSVYQDATVMKNVEITGCTFSNVPRGVGTHTFLLGAYHDNIKISNNTFKNVKKEAIVCLGYKNCEIKNNTIIDCGAGILFQYFKSTPKSVYSTVKDGEEDVDIKVEHDANTVISGNNITIRYTEECSEIQAIKLYGLDLTIEETGADGREIPMQNYYVSGVTVKNNTIVTAGYGIHLADAVDCTITDNTILARGLTPSDPHLQTSYYDGIYISKGSSVKKISNNTITGMDGYGMRLYSSSMVTGEISGNTIRECGRSGIRIYSSSKVTGDISGNKISNAAGYGIYVSGKSTVSGKIRDNTVDTVQMGGILIDSGSKVKGDISGNRVSDVAGDGILIDKNSAVTGAIGDNKITSAGGCGIYISDTSGAATVGSIKDNTIKTTGSYGIHLKSTKNNVTISGNHVNGCSSHCLVIQPSSSKYGITIWNNTMEGKGDTDFAIYIVNGDVNVSDNTISNVECGVYAAYGVTGSIDWNIYEKGVSKRIYLEGTACELTKAAKK